MEIAAAMNRMNIMGSLSCSMIMSRIVWSLPFLSMFSPDWRSLSAASVEERPVDEWVWKVSSNWGVVNDSYMGSPPWIMYA